MVIIFKLSIILIKPTRLIVKVGIFNFTLLRISDNQSLKKRKYYIELSIRYLLLIK